MENKASFPHVYWMFSGNTVTRNVIGKCEKGRRNTYKLCTKIYDSENLMENHSNLLLCLRFISTSCRREILYKRRKTFCSVYTSYVVMKTTGCICTWSNEIWKKHNTHFLQPPPNHPLSWTSFPFEMRPIEKSPESHLKFNSIKSNYVNE